VDVAIQDRNEVVQFRIPKVFMTFSRNWEGGLQSGITLEVVYPSMGALSAARNTTVGSDVVIINLQSFVHTGVDYNISNFLPMLMATQWAFVWNTTDGLGRPYRLYVNKADVEKKQDESRTIEEFFVPEKSGTYLECLRQASNELAGCSGVVNYGQALSLRFQFKRSQFDRWPEIGKAVVVLLDSFRQRTSSH
jgi:hypothetical protein